MIYEDGFLGIPKNGKNLKVDVKGIGRKARNA